MKLIKSAQDKGLENARTALEDGTPDDIVRRAECYLELLDEHLSSLRSLKGIPQASFAAQSKFANLLIEQTRSSIRTEIETSTGEKNRIQALLDSLLMISGWTAVQTFNQQEYLNACDWELIGTNIRSSAAGAAMKIPDAVIEAGRLRREAYYTPRKAAA
jgi:hypothetical protein